MVIKRNHKTILYNKFGGPYFLTLKIYLKNTVIKTVQGCRVCIASTAQRSPAPHKLSMVEQVCYLVQHIQGTWLQREEWPMLKTVLKENDSSTDTHKKNSLERNVCVYIRTHAFTLGTCYLVIYLFILNFLLLRIRVCMCACIGQTQPAGAGLVLTFNQTVLRIKFKLFLSFFLLCTSSH